MYRHNLSCSFVPKGPSNLPKMPSVHIIVKHYKWVEINGTKYPAISPECVGFGEVRAEVHRLKNELDDSKQDLRETVLSHYEKWHDQR